MYPKNRDNKFFQNPASVAINHEKILKDPQKVSKIKIVIDKHKCKEITFPSHRKSQKKFE